MGIRYWPVWFVFLSTVLENDFFETHKTPKRYYLKNKGFGNIENTESGNSFFTKQNFSVLSLFQNKKLFLKTGTKQTAPLVLFLIPTKNGKIMYLSSHKKPGLRIIS